MNEDFDHLVGKWMVFTRLNYCQVLHHIGHGFYEIQGYLAEDDSKNEFTEILALPDIANDYMIFETQQALVTKMAEEDDEEED